MDGTVSAPNTPSQDGPLAQRLEQGTHNPLVLGSNPRRPTTPDRRPLRAGSAMNSGLGTGLGTSFFIPSRRDLGSPGRWTEGVQIGCR